MAWPGNEIFQCLENFPPWHCERTEEEENGQAEEWTLGGHAELNEVRHLPRIQEQFRNGADREISPAGHP